MKTKKKNFKGVNWNKKKFGIKRRELLALQRWAREWVNSEEGQKAIGIILKESKETIELLEQARKVDLKSLLDTITI